MQFSRVVERSFLQRLGLEMSPATCRIVEVVAGRAVAGGWRREADVPFLPWMCGLFL